MEQHTVHRMSRSMTWVTTIGVLVALLWLFVGAYLQHVQASPALTGTGFTTAVSNLVPGDVTNRYVELTNSGTSAVQALTIGIADPVPTKLTDDATNGLQVSISSCSVVWTTAGKCTGATTPLVTSSASALRTTAASLISGPMAAGAVQHLKFSLALPNQSEVTDNGVLPAGTIQGLAANLTWTVTEGRPTAATTSSPS